MSLPPRIYLAGPMVFYPDAQMNQIFSEMKKICAAHGFEGVAPIDAQLDLQGVVPGRPLFRKIVLADYDLMEQVDAAIFCLDPFREKIEMDVGTAVEVGYMFKLGKPMSGWTIDARDYPQKISDYYNGQVTDAGTNSTGATSGTLRDPQGMLIHSAGLYQHGMVQTSIELRGGTVFADSNWKTAFENAVRDIYRQLTLNNNPRPEMQQP